jgi:hypothetical protein
MQLALALELQQLGITPERSVNLLQMMPNPVAEAALLSLTGDPRRPTPVFICFDPHGLQGLAEVPPDEEDQAIMSCEIATMERYLEFIRRAAPARLAALNIAPIIVRMSALLTRERLHPFEFISSLEEWAAEERERLFEMLRSKIPHGSNEDGHDPEA